MTALACAPLTPEQAEVVAGWVASQAEVTLFAGPALGFPLTGQALLATNTPTWQVLGLCDESGTFVATGSLGTTGEGTARIGRLLVDPALRGRGLGRAVMEALISRAREIPDVSAVTLGVFERNANARHLYESLGFVDTGQRTHSTVDGQRWPSIQMRRELS